jgi:short-subunit dehydrogenase
VSRQALPWRTVWITGGSSGIGEEFARLIDGRVDYVAISARSAAKLSEIARASASIKAFPIDVTDENAVNATAAAVEAACGPIDLAVLNAGTWNVVKIDAFDPAEFRTSMEVNYQGVVNGIAAVLPGMIERGSGHIAVVSSIAGYRGLPKAAAYGPTKAALINLVESLRPELEARGVKISLVSPGFVDTPLTAKNSFPMPFLMPVDKAAERMLQGLLDGRYEVIFPRRLAYALKFLRVLPNVAFFWIVRNFIFRKKR